MRLCLSTAPGNQIVEAGRPTSRGRHPHSRLGEATCPSLHLSIQTGAEARFHIYVEALAPGVRELFDLWGQGDDLLIIVINLDWFRFMHFYNLQFAGTVVDRRFQGPKLRLGWRSVQGPELWFGWRSVQGPVFRLGWPEAGAGLHVPVLWGGWRLPSLRQLDSYDWMRTRILYWGLQRCTEILLFILMFLLVGLLGGLLLLRNLVVSFMLLMGRIGGSFHRLLIHICVLGSWQWRMRVLAGRVHVLAGCVRVMVCAAVRCVLLHPVLLGVCGNRGLEGEGGFHHRCAEPLYQRRRLERTLVLVLLVGAG